MIRFFAVPTEEASTDRITAFLNSRGVVFSTSQSSVEVIRFALPENEVSEFQIAASDARIPYYHDPLLTPPAVSPVCRGAEGFGNLLRKSLEDSRTLDGKGALIVIVDSGVDLNSLKQCGVRVVEIESPVTDPASTITHGTMCALDALLAAPNADIGCLRVSTTEAATASTLYEGFHLLRKIDIEGYKACILSVSLHVPIEERQVEAKLDSIAGTTPLAGNKEHPTWKAVAAVSDYGFDVLLAAGNDGCVGVPIGGLALHPRALTIGAVDYLGILEPRSSSGPETSTKPDLTAYTNFLWSELYGIGSYDAGTSAATALAAGLIATTRVSKPNADRRTLLPSLLPEKIKDWVRMPDGLEGVHNKGYGWGIL